MGKTLPNNWINTELGNILDIITNGINIEQLDYPINDKSLPISRIETIANETIDFNRVKYCIPTQEQHNKYLIAKGDILFSHINSDKHLGKTAIYNSETPLIHGVNLLRLRSYENIYNSFLLNYVFKYLRMQGAFIDIAQRAVNQSSINQKKLNNVIIPLPPLPEQERIANKLDVLFTQLDGIRAAMEPIPSFLKNFRQQILTQAVTGKLTDVDPQKRYLKELLLDVKYGTSKKSDYDIDGIPVLRIPNINEGEINLNDLKYTIFEEKEYEQLKLKDGDILIIRSNGSISLVGQTAIVRKKHEGYSYAGYLIRMRCNQDLDPEFLNFSLRSGFVRSQIIDLAHSTSGVNNINAEQIKGLKICWFSIPEQQEIVRRVESLFSQADVIEQQCLSLKQKIDNLPQAILHKAFKGELVEQLPTDGDARDLLHQIEELKQLTKK